MADIIPFKKPRLSVRHKGKTLCSNGFHKWIEDKKTGFDVKKGKLITQYKCTRCGKTRVKST